MLSQEQKYNAIIADPEPQTRLLLKQATAALRIFGLVQQFGVLSEALSSLSSDEPCHLVFISHHFDAPTILSFVEQAKTTSQGQVASYVLVLSSLEQTHQEVAKRVLQGLDGFLFEPYSVHYLNEITEIAASIRKERIEARERVALTLLLTDLISQLDLVAKLKKQGFDCSYEWKQLTEMGSALRKFSDGEGLRRYFEVAEHLFLEAPAGRRRAEEKQYAGASMRVRRKIQRNLVRMQEEVRTQRSRIIKK